VEGIGLGDRVGRLVGSSDIGVGICVVGVIEGDGVGNVDGIVVGDGLGIADGEGEGLVVVGNSVGLGLGIVDGI